MQKTAEAVSPKHPDKLCDQISDAILDACLTQDPFSRTAIETMGGHGQIYIVGEVTTKAKVDFVAIAQQVVGQELKVLVNIVQQSPEISRGVDIGGAGDQGIMVGYACSETPEFIPLDLKLARDLCKFLYSDYDSDGKTQITLQENKIKTVVASFQNSTQADLIKKINVWLQGKEQTDDLEIKANPAGDWEQGGFTADTGLTGRKLIIDNYGPQVPIGGGAFSGKDASKVDRSAAYMARRVAVDYLQKRKAKQVYCYLAYSIGVAEPVMSRVIIDGVEEAVQGYDLRPEAIIQLLDLRKPQFTKTARWGHFGEGFAWDSNVL